MQTPGQKSSTSIKVIAISGAITALCAVALASFVLVPGMRARLDIEHEKSLTAASSLDLQEQQKQQTIADAQAIGTALTAYYHDYDALPPDHVENWRAISDRYLKPEVLLPVGGRVEANGMAFTYIPKDLHPKPPLNAVKIGYKVGPGGRAEIYGDGHTEWISVLEDNTKKVRR